MTADISYRLLTKHRFTLFFISLVWIFFRHTYYYNNYTYGVFDPIVQIGDCGVDIFLFLSGFGLYFSYSKTSSLLEFYKKRLLRILPSVILLLAVFAVVNDLRSDNIEHLIISPSYWFFSLYIDYWFIGAILSFYFIYPILFKVVNKYSTWSIMFVVTSISLLSIFVILYFNNALAIQLVVYCARLPIFTIGALFAAKLKLLECRRIYLILFLLSIPLIYILPKEYQRMAYIPLVLFFVSYLPYYIDKLPNKVLTITNLLGEKSIEFYFIHIFLFNLGILSCYKMNQPTLAIIVLILVFVLSVLFNHIFKLLDNKIKYVIKC